ncbi:MAG: Ig-like domain repeat protein [Candidatus Eisenbacteria bacterium]|uniref:Ig-like domain repeat protein n=1 Tax=Eiseniibacteriota bacterium TaxID=2212470 RepID=A0A538UD87_UNCEI|nr:MAG: Ig-like domain repeat protein [Candidatus Eisenbacteria bacterium]
MPAGTHTLIAKYSGDGRYGPSQSDAIPHDVIASATATTLVSDPNPSAWGGKVDLRATVDRGAATGTVEFFDGATSLGTAPVSDGVVLLSVSHLSVGTHELTADYGGDACFAGSRSAAMSQVVNLAATTATLNVEPAATGWGQAVGLSAAVDPAAATGTVQFWDGLNPIGPPQPVMDGVATLSWMDLSVGSHALVAKYSGDDYYEPSQSQAVPHDVASGSSIVSLDAQPAQTQCGETVRLSAVVDPAAASGTVQFCDGLDPIGPPQAVSDGVATLSWTDLPAGTHTLIAKYSGDGRYGPSQSDAIPHDVIASATATTLVSSPRRWGSGARAAR